ncbi:unnamed protein product [Cyclocybe aegerita]|uniref:Uncharacterized protein n=1 Tax=Cyclocybe aegerita TaxID=1973307 RepID=A0A8S0W9Y1_CYCAE|nr:unnamed protein product [Cyclocybe aegerita]
MPDLEDLGNPDTAEEHVELPSFMSLLNSGSEGIDLIEELRNNYANDPFFTKILEKPKEFHNFEVENGIMYLKEYHFLVIDSTSTPPKQHTVSTADLVACLDFDADLRAKPAQVLKHPSPSSYALVSRAFNALAKGKQRFAIITTDNRVERKGSAMWADVFHLTPTDCGITTGSEVTLSGPQDLVNVAWTLVFREGVRAIQFKERLKQHADARKRRAALQLNTHTKAHRDSDRRTRTSSDKESTGSHHRRRSKAGRKERAALLAESSATTTTTEETVKEELVEEDAPHEVDDEVRDEDVDMQEADAPADDARRTPDKAPTPEPAPIPELAPETPGAAATPAIKTACTFPVSAIDTGATAAPRERVPLSALGHIPKHSAMWDPNKSIADNMQFPESPRPSTLTSTIPASHDLADPAFAVDDPMDGQAITAGTAVDFASTV